MTPAYRDFRVVRRLHCSGRLKRSATAFFARSMFDGPFLYDMGAIRANRWVALDVMEPRP